MIDTLAKLTEWNDRKKSKDRFHFESLANRPFCFRSFYEQTHMRRSFDFGLAKFGDGRTQHPAKVGLVLFLLFAFDSTQIRTKRWTAHLSEHAAEESTPRTQPVTP